MLEASYATAAPQAVTALVASDWAVGPVEDCTLLNRGFNDIYAVRAGGADYVLRITVPRSRGAPDVADEVAFLEHLAARAVPVAAGVRTRHGGASASAALPDGAREAALFRAVSGRPPGQDNVDDARAQGVTLALLHDAAAEYAGRGTYRLDATHLLERPLEAAVAVRPGEAWGAELLAAVAGRLRQRLEAAAPGLAWTRCHGDCHGANALIGADGVATFFDFDDGGTGFLAYDLGVFLWAQFSFGRSRPAVWRAFLAGYRAVRPLRREDLAALELFAAVRQVWLLGEYAGQRQRWGSGLMTAAWLRAAVEWLAAWERERLEGLFT